MGRRRTVFDDLELEAPLAVEVPRAFAEVLYQGDWRYRVLYGGRGAAKSHQVAQALLLMGHQQPRRILCTRELQSSMKQSVLALLEHYIPILELDEVYTVRRDGLFHTNGTEFLFMGLRHNVNEIKGTEGIDLCWVEEGQAVSKNSWDVLTPTIRREGSEIWVTFNPLLATDPTYEMFITNPPADAIVRKVTFRDNPWFPDVLRKDMEARRANDLEGYLHIWEGELWKRSALQILHNWRVEEFEPAEEWHGPYFGIDFGFSNDPLVVVRCWIFDNVLYLDHVEGGRKIENDDIRRVVDRVPLAGAHTIRCDSSRPETISHINQPAEDGTKLRAVGADKWAGSVEDGIAHLQNYRAIVVHPRCQLAIDEFKLWRFKADALTGDPLRKPADGNDNVADAVRYAIEPIIRLSTRRLRPAIVTGKSNPPPAGPPAPGAKPPKPPKPGRPPFRRAPTRFTPG